MRSHSVRFYPCSESHHPRLSTSQILTLVVLTAGLLLPGAKAAFAQDSYVDQGSVYQAPSAEYALNTRQPLIAGELEQLVAPIALYPDPLVAQVLAASTYPQQVVEADRWRQEHGYAGAYDIAAGADVQPWDPSVKALTAFPQVLAQMDRNLQWTTDLGNAYYNQPQDVLEAVQIMRRRAQGAGYLQSTPQEVVREDAGVVQVVPANPEVVYVPAYNPWAVYGEPVNPYPGFSLLDSIGDFLGSNVLRWGLGIAMNAFKGPWGWLAWGLDWLGHALLFHDSAWYSNSGTVADWGFPHHRFYAYSGRGGFGRGSEVGRGWGHEEWRHEGGGREGWGHESFRDAVRGHENWGNESWRHEGNASGWHAFNRGSERQAEWNRPSGRGFESLRGDRSSVGRSSVARLDERSNQRFFSSFNHNSSSRMPENRIAQRGAFNDRGNSRREYASLNNLSRNESRGRSHSITQVAGKSHGGSHLFGGGGSGKSFGGSHSSHFGGGHAPKSFGGGGGSHGSKGLGGGGHSHGGGHSGGGHSGKHHR